MLTVSSDQHQTPHPQTRSTPTLLRRADEMLERGRLACGSFITIVMGTLLRAGCDVLREQAPGTHGLVPASEGSRLEGMAGTVCRVLVGSASSRKEGGSTVHVHASRRYCGVEVALRMTDGFTV